MTNNEFFEIYKQHILRHPVPGTTLPRLSLIRCHLLPLLGDEDIGSTSPADINQLYDNMQQSGYAHNTIFGAYAAVHIYFKLAYELGYIATNPAPLARVITPDTMRTRRVNN